MTIMNPAPSPFKPEPGWLMKTCHDAYISCMADHGPTFYAGGPLDFQTPINDTEAAAVFSKMDARFKAWTGKSLAEFVSLEQKVKKD